MISLLEKILQLMHFTAQFNIREFGVRFTTDEVAGIKSVADILKKIS